MDTLERPAPAHAVTRRSGSALLLANAQDTELVQRVVSAHIAPHVLEVPHGARVDAVLRRLHVGSFSAFRLAYGCPAELRLHPRRQEYLVLLMGAPGGSLETDRKTVPLTPAIVGPEGRAILRLPADAWVTLLMIPRKTLERAAPAHWQDAIRFETHMDTANYAAGPWLALAQEFLRTRRAARSPGRGTRWRGSSTCWSTVCSSASPVLCGPATSAVSTTCHLVSCARWRTASRRTRTRQVSPR